MLEHVDTILGFVVVMLLLSLLVTTLVQIVVVASAQRSRVLKLGIERLLIQVAPKLKEHAPQIADAVRCHPTVVTDMSYPAVILEKLWLWVTHRPAESAGKNPATALQAAELIRLLDDLAQDSTIGLDENVKKELKKALEVAALPEMNALANTVQAELEKVFPVQSEVAQIKRIVSQARENACGFGAKVNAWFNTVMDRTTDEFRNRTRWVTVACAVVLPFVLHIDSLQIFRQLASDPDVRAKLVQTADATLDKAAESLALAEGSASLASSGIEQACKDLPQIAATYAIENVPSGLATRAQGDAWLSVKFKESRDPNHPKLFQAAYYKRYDEIAGAKLQGLVQSANEIKTTLDKSALTIFAIGEPWGTYWGYWTHGMHVLGMLITAVFLSLGAPFWYNALKQLSNLRPTIAQKIDAAAETKE